HFAKSHLAPQAVANGTTAEETLLMSTAMQETKQGSRCVSVCVIYHPPSVHCLCLEMEKNISICRKNGSGALVLSTATANVSFESEILLVASVIEPFGIGAAVVASTARYCYTQASLF
ncbi:unnamed protein product, partial [Ectocarpus sp. 12 AP-2014]